MIWIKFEQDYWAGRSYQIPQICLILKFKTCCDTTAALVVQGRHKGRGRAAAVTQKQNFLGLSDHLKRPNHFSGRFKVHECRSPV